MARESSQRLRNYDLNRLNKKEADIMSIGGKVPPHSLDAEIAVLGAMMVDRQAIAKVFEILDEDSFYIEKHHAIFKAMMEMFSKGESVDIITLAEKLTKEGALEFVGGTYYLTEINAKTPSSANVEFHAFIVQEKFLRRKLINISGEIIESSYDDTNDALSQIDYAEQKIFEIAGKRFKKSYVTMSKLAHNTFDELLKTKERNKSGLSGISTGFKAIDNYLGGFQKSDFIIIAGRPSMGKTAFALSIARNTAIGYGNSVAFFSIEMAASQLVIRLLSAEARIDQQKIKIGDIDPENTRIINAMSKLHDAPIVIDDSPMLTVLDLKAKCRRLKAEHDVQLVMIDYLQLMQSPKAESREREISMISQSLKQIAKELDIPVVAMSQLNRSVESRTDKRPLLSDLRESGSIEQDADVIMFVHRPEYYGITTYEDKKGNKRSTEGIAEIIIGKHRNGPVGTARIAFVKDFARFENLTYVDDKLPEMMEGYNEDFNEDDPF